MIDVETIFDSDREEYEFMQQKKEQPMKEQIEEMAHDEVYQRYKEKKRLCKTIAQEVELITSDHEMIMLRERLMRDNYEKSKRTN